MVKEPTSQAGGPRALQPSEGLPLPKAISAHKPWAHAALPRPGRQCAPLRLHSEAPLILPAPEDHPAMRQLTGISSDFWIPDLVPLRNHQPKVSVLPGGSTFRVLSQSVLFITNIFTKEYKTCNIYFNSPRVSLSTNALSFLNYAVSLVLGLPLRTSLQHPAWGMGGWQRYFAFSKVTTPSFPSIGDGHSAWALAFRS